MDKSYFNFCYKIKPIIHKENKKLSRRMLLDRQCCSYVISYNYKDYYDITLDLFSRPIGKNFITFYKDKLPKKDSETESFLSIQEEMKSLWPMRSFILRMYETLLIKKEDREDLEESLTLLDEVKETKDTIIYPFSIDERLHYQLEKLLTFYFTHLKTNLNTDYNLVSGEILLDNKLFKHFNVFSLDVKLKERQNGKKYFNFYLVLNSGHFFYKLKRDTREQTWVLDEIQTITSDEVCFLEYYRVLKKDLQKFITGYDYAVEISDFLKERYGELIENTFNLYMSNLDFVAGYGKNSEVLSERFHNEKIEFNFLLNSIVRQYLKQLPEYNKIKHIKF